MSKILRTEKGEVKTYELEEGKVKIVDTLETRTVVIADLKESVKKIFSAITVASDPSFSIEEADEIMIRLETATLAAGNKIEGGYSPSNI